MTALDIFRECARLDGKIGRIEERIERRRALATGCTARPLSPDGGSIGGGDASVRMLDYMADIQALEEDRQRQIAERATYRGCCLYLSDLLEPILAGVALRAYLEHKGTGAIAEEINYSPATVRRYRKQADEALANIEIMHWDKCHVPLYTLH